MNRSRKRNRPLGDIPQNLRPEHVERATQVPFTEQPLKFRKESDQPYIPQPGSLPLEKLPPRNVALRGRFSQQGINVTDVAKTPLSANPKRVYFIIQNNGANDVYINFGNKATIGNIKIIPNGNYEPTIAPVNSISVVCASGLTSICSILEAAEVD